jgi:aspartyl-tRNA(Asn)/glutamyl-tRNA(Gln) amidotransferase subunit B
LNDNDLELRKTKLTVKNFVMLLKMIQEDKFTKRVGRQILKDVINGKSPESLAKAKKLEKISDEAVLSKICDEVIAENQDVVQKLAAKPKAFQALVGEVMKKTKGMADYEMSQNILKKKLNIQ